MGVSNGGRLLAQYAWQYPIIKKLRIVNAPLMINWPKTKKGIERYKGEKVFFVYGDKDPSYRYSELISLINSDAEVNLEIIEDVDHQFRNLNGLFIKLPEKLFANEVN